MKNNKAAQTTVITFFLYLIFLWFHPVCIMSNMVYNKYKILTVISASCHLHHRGQGQMFNPTVTHTLCVCVCVCGSMIHYNNVMI